MKRLMVLLFSLFLVFGLFACGGDSSSSSSDDSDDSGDVSDSGDISAFVGQWDGPFNVSDGSDDDSGYAIVTINSDQTGSILLHLFSEDSGHETFDISASDEVLSQAISIEDDVLYLDIDNPSPDEEECDNWDVQISLTIEGTLGGGGTTCGDDDDESVTFSGSLAFSENANDYAFYRYMEFFAEEQAYVSVSDVVTDWTSAYLSTVSTDGSIDGESTISVDFDDNGVQMGDGEFRAISANGEYFIGASNTYGAHISLGIADGFNDGDTTLLDGSYRVIGIENPTDLSEDTVITVVTDSGPTVGPFYGDGYWGTSPEGDIYYEISGKGNITIGDGTSGQINEDGTVFIRYKYDADEDPPSIYVFCSIKESSGKSNASLSGTYSLCLIDSDGYTPEDLNSAYGTITFDGDGAYTAQSDSLNSGESFDGTYEVEDNGDITMDGSSLGRISQDNELVVFGDASSEVVDEGPPPVVAYNDPFIAVAVKQ